MEALTQAVLALQPVAPYVLGIFVVVGFTVVAVVAMLRGKNVKTPIGSIDQPRQELPPPPSRELAVAAPQLPEATPYIKQREAVLNQWVAETPNAIAFLVRDLAITQTKLFALSTYQFIYNSQVLLLEKLREKNGTITLAEAKKYYQSVKTEFAPAFDSVSFETYMKLLVEQTLVAIDNKVTLTELGADFLRAIEASPPGYTRPY